MPALRRTDFVGEIVWLGQVTSPDRKELMAPPVEFLDLGFDGLAGSVHQGATRPSCVRVKDQYPEGTVIRNTRQVSIVSQEDLDQIAKEMGIDRVDPARLGATIVLAGIPDFTFVPPSARLQAKSGATLTVDMENHPCHFPARSLEVIHPGKGKGFKAAAKHRRGVTAWVEREGQIQIGDTMRLHVPDQRAWDPR